MKFEFENLLAVAVLFAAMLGAQRLGQWFGRRRGNDDDGLGVSETAVFSILGLFLAFAFSGAAERFEARRTMVVSEVNAIGTAWLRLDLLPQGKEAIRKLVVDYVDLRIETYRLVENEAAAWAMNSKAIALQNRIWTEVTAVLPAPDPTSARVVLLPALNEMFDIASTRTAATRQHPPLVVFIMLVLLALVGAAYAGYSLSGRKHATWFHVLGFPAVLTLVLFVIVDLEYPRLGFIRVDAADQMLVELRQSLSP
jgi:hypothetical protein